MKYKIEIETDNKLFTDRIESALSKLLLVLDKSFSKRDFKRINYKTEVVIKANYKNSIRIEEDLIKQEELY